MAVFAENDENIKRFRRICGYDSDMGDVMDCREGEGPGDCPHYCLGDLCERGGRGVSDPVHRIV